MWTNEVNFFTSQDAYREIEGLSPERAAIWAKIANLEYARLLTLNSPQQYCIKRAKEVAKAAIQERETRYGIDRA